MTGKKSLKSTQESSHSFSTDSLADKRAEELVKGNEPLPDVELQPIENLQEKPLTSEELTDKPSSKTVPSVVDIHFGNSVQRSKHSGRPHSSANRKKAHPQTNNSIFGTKEKATARFYKSMASTGPARYLHMLGHISKLSKHGPSTSKVKQPDPVVLFDETTAKPPVEKEPFCAYRNSKHSVSSRRRIVGNEPSSGKTQSCPPQETHEEEKYVTKLEVFMPRFSRRMDCLIPGYSRKVTVRKQSQQEDNGLGALESLLTGSQSSVERSFAHCAAYRSTEDKLRQRLGLLQPLKSKRSARGSKDSQISGKTKEKVRGTVGNLEDVDECSHRPRNQVTGHETPKKNPGDVAPSSHPEQDYATTHPSARLALKNNRNRRFSKQHQIDVRHLVDSHQDIDAEYLLDQDTNDHCARTTPHLEPPDTQLLSTKERKRRVREVTLSRRLQDPSSREGPRARGGQSDLAPRPRERRTYKELFLRERSYKNRHYVLEDGTVRRRGWRHRNDSDDECTLLARNYEATRGYPPTETVDEKASIDTWLERSRYYQEKHKARMNKRRIAASQKMEASSQHRIAPSQQRRHQSKPRRLPPIHINITSDVRGP